MKQFNIDEWPRHNKRKSALERAKLLLSDDNNSPKNISMITDINYQTILNYKQDLSKLDNASWKNVDRLGKLYDICEIQRNLPDETMLDLQYHIHLLLKELKLSSSYHDGFMIDQIEEIICRDPVALYRIYSHLKK